ncbi:hypothetical protein [Clostridium beijerinckii]|nr:hypothetical protein [Clostridium beijerinckii]NRU14107.1 cell division ATPase FtsA [Clostridium beijerinckii]
MQQEIITSLDFGTQKLSATVAIREKDELKNFRSSIMQISRYRERFVIRY